MKKKVFKMVGLITLLAVIVTAIYAFTSKDNGSSVSSSKNSCTVIVKYSSGLAASGIKVSGDFTDSRDSKIYKTVTIGTQTWMAENLAYKASSGCWALNDDVTNVAKYGYLYNWKTAKTVCPTGWHLPTDAEWTTLTTYLGGESVAGGKLKEIGTTHWTSPNTGATNESGFTALPGGYRDATGASSRLIGYEGIWWSSTESNASRAWVRVMGCDYGNVNRSYSNKTSVFSVRCVRDK